MPCVGQVRSGGISQGSGGSNCEAYGPSGPQCPRSRCLEELAWDYGDIGDLRTSDTGGMDNADNENVAPNLCEKRLEVLGQELLEESSRRIGPENQRVSAAVAMSTHSPPPWVRGSNTGGLATDNDPRPVFELCTFSFEFPSLF